MLFKALDTNSSRLVTSTKLTMLTCLGKDPVEQVMQAPTYPRRKFECLLRARHMIFDHRGGFRVVPRKKFSSGGLDRWERRSILKVDTCSSVTDYLVTNQLGKVGW